MQVSLNFLPDKQLQRLYTTTLQALPANELLDHHGLEVLYERCCFDEVSKF